MKRLLSILFVLAGIAFSHSAIAQTSNTDKKKAAKKTDSTATQNSKQSDGAATGAGGITIDESGVPKVKSKPQSTAAPAGSPTPVPKDEAKDQQSNEKTTGAGAGAADDISPIAIDESGTPKVKKGKVTAATTQDSVATPSTPTPK